MKNHAVYTILLLWYNKTESICEEVHFVSLFGQISDAIKYILRKADLLLLTLCLIATGFGIVLIASATNYTLSQSR